MEIELIQMTGNITAKQSYAIIFAEDIVDNLIASLKKQGRDFDIIQESLGNLL